jgi:hypothetical protein
MGHAGLPFDRTFSAETVHAYKPSPAMYQQAISGLGLQPSEILMVAAHDFDLNAAKSHGMQTAFISRSTEAGPDGMSSSSYNYNVTSLAQLAQQLAAGSPTLAEDCLSVTPAAVQVKQVSGNWSLVDGNDLMMNFGASQANANKAQAVITHYGLDRMCYVGRPHAPMMYFTVKGKSPTGAMAGEDAIPFNLANVHAQLSGTNWIVTDGASSLLNFGGNELNAVHAVAILRAYGFTHQCFVGRPNGPMMYFRT